MSDENLLVLRRAVDLDPQDSIKRRRLFHAMVRSGKTPCRSCEGSGVQPPVEPQARAAMGEYAAKLEATEFAVEATHCERSELWARWSKQALEIKAPGSGRWLPDDMLLDWSEEPTGFWWTVCNVAVSVPGEPAKQFPICVSCSWAIIEGRRVLFWEATSQVVYFSIVKDWIHANTGNGHRVSTSDATNFGNIANELKRRAEARKATEA